MSESVLHAVRERRFLVSAWPWRALAYLGSSAPVGLAAAVPFGLLVVPWLAFLRRLADGKPLTTSGLVLIPAGLVLLGVLGPLIAVPLADVERARLRLVDDRPLLVARRPRYTDPETWRAVAYALLLLTLGQPDALRELADRAPIPWVVPG